MRNQPTKINIIIFLLFLYVFEVLSATESLNLSGNGTRNNPYLISSYMDLELFRDMVNSGNPEWVSACYRQTCDIVFPKDKKWEPIGKIREHIPFIGEYNGDGHIISNINCEAEYAGFFEFLGGTVYNLGIESGKIYGDCIGSITSHGTPTGRIINCYNKADLCAVYRAGGICDNFPGLVMFCFNFGKVEGLEENTIKAGICSYGCGIIRYSYSTIKNVVDFSTYTGDISDSYCIGNDGEEIQNLLNSIYQKFASIVPVQFPNYPEQIISVGENFSFTDFHLPLYTDKFCFSTNNKGVLIEAKKANKLRYQERVNKKYIFSGNGTKYNPYKIKSYEDLCILRDNVNMGCLYEDIYFEQTADIYFPKDEVWKPIGDVFLNLPFKGIYNGNGYSLINIYCYNQYASVFALLDGVVKNLLIENGFFYGSTIGSIVSHGTKNGIIENVVNNSMVKGVHRCGGICDNFSGTIKSCKNIGNIIGNYDYTILAGITSYGNGKIINCECDILPLVNELTFSGNIISNNKMNELGTTLVGILLSFLIVFTIIASIYCFVKNIKKTLSGIIFPVTSFLVIFAIIYNFVNVYISTPITAGVLQFHNFNKKENQNTDVLFLGGSTMSCNFELSELWKKYGIAGFCGGAGISSIEDSYFRLIKFQKIHPVKNVVVEISGTRFKYNYGNTEQTLNNVSGMPFCLDKIKYICSAIEPSKRNAYLTKLPLFHENWKKINKWYFLRSSELGDDDKGTWTVMHGNFYKPVLLDANNYVDYQFLNDKQELFLKKIISFCVNNEINLVFLKSVDAARWQNQSVWNTVEVIADEFSVPLLDFNYLDDTIGIDSDDFYYDDRHLNVLGARKNTQYLAEFIRKYFNLDNHKDSIEYKSWEKFSENRESLYLKSIYNTEEYLFELARDEKLVYMIPYRISNNVVSYLQQDFPELELINSVPLTLEYGKVSTVLLGEKSVDISKNYDKLDIISNGDKKRISITKSGLILLSCDIVNEKIADIVLISDDNKKLIRF